MLCPEVWNFPPPKVMESKKVVTDIETIKNTLNRNYFYRSLIVTFPDETHTPNFIQEMITEDSDYYKLSKVSLAEFVEPVFIESFVKAGQIFCLSANRNCIVQNCVALTLDGVLVLHVLEHIFQTLGFEGTKRSHGYYEVRIDLKFMKSYNKVKLGLAKLELFDLYLVWEPSIDNVCPSSIAKYFQERGVSVSVHSLTVRNISPDITEVPTLTDTDAAEMTEWIGMLAHQADINPSEAYISSYCQPECESPLKTSRISLCIVKGFITSSLVSKLSEKLNVYVTSRETDNYWASLSVQSDQNSLWQWITSSPQIFQPQDSSCNIFFTHQEHIIYCVGQLKYS